MFKATMSEAAKFAAVLFHDEDAYGTYKTEYEYEIMCQIREAEDITNALANVRRPA
jgi:hypothetical protein